MLTIMIVVCVVVAIQLVIASVFARCAEQKGYQKSPYFWACFLCGVIGYCVVAALPDKVLNEKLSEALKMN